MLLKAVLTSGGCSVEMRNLGSTGMAVSPLALGTMSFGQLGNTDHAECIRMIHHSLDSGINVIDTADFYSNGESERIVGKALTGRRDDVVLATKCFWPMGSDPNRRGLSRRWITTACEESLTRLGTDHVDIYYLHKPDSDTDIDESLGAMSDLVHQGKIRTVAISTFPADLIVEAQWAADRRCHVRPKVEQPPYSVLNRHIERDVLPTCARYGMGTMVWSPLNGGFLTGKYRRGSAAPPGSRAGRWPSSETKFNESRTQVKAKFAAVEKLQTLADDADLPLSHLALSFAVEHPAVTAALIGPRTMEQLDGLLGAADVSLSPEILDEIDAIVPPGADLDPMTDAGWTPPWLLDASFRRRKQAQ
jgi:aryl-alcohol dehydrogenase-like predicted oxidoreductase